ncbi:MAG: recombinase family protein [Clostridiales bacterium]|nr:MAG: recombinase family protein [Clostridiales bacterium]
MNRPGMKRLLILAETKQINCVIVKDFSRFARDYIEVGRYAEQKFPEWQIRFISVNDGYDSNDFKGITGGIDMAMKSIAYTMYSRDLSEKVKSARKILQKQGKYFAPYAFYGYVKSPDDKHKLIVDSVAAKIVKRIFALRISGSSPAQIAYILNEDKVPTPSVYKKMNDPLTRDWNTVSEYCKWSSGTVVNILRDERYTGKLIAQKYERIAVGSSKVRAVASENRIVVPNTHASIISQKTYDEVQALSKRKKA